MAPAIRETASVPAAYMHCTRSQLVCIAQALLRMMETLGLGTAVCGVVVLVRHPARNEERLSC